jgi:ParB family transcriptional regulator, chromosome partitioning protein
LQNTRVHHSNEKESVMERKPEKRALGRGLSELMSDVNLSGNGAAPAAADQIVPIELIHPNPLQPRKDFDPAALAELASSIQLKGIIQPLIVRPAQQAGHFEIVAGERRWRAAQIAALHKIPILIRTLSDQEVLELAIIENIQRENLNAVEEALGYKQLMDVYGHTQEMVATALSKSRSHIANLLRLLSLPPEVQALVRNGALSAGHARALITSVNAAAMAQTVVQKGLSVRQTEELARKIRTDQPRQSKSGGFEKDADTRSIESDLSASLGMRVQITHEAGTGKGTIAIRYGSLEDLDALCQALSIVRRDILAR